MYYPQGTLSPTREYKLHYVLEKVSNRAKPNQSRQIKFLANTVVPFLHVYSHHWQQNTLKLHFPSVNVENQGLFHSYALFHVQLQES